MRRAIAFLMLVSTAAFAAGQNQKKSGVVEETDEEQMVTQVEQMGKTIQQALSKIANQFKAGGADSNAAKIDLEKLSQELTKSQAALKGQTGRQPAAPAPNQAMMKTLQSFLQNMNSKLLDNVNQTVDKLEKLGDDGL